ncbi:MAG: DUF1704 domain-containing protein [Candidatus Omnitrophica bacterium]|nr:DUF1704 domain-containing protein [Candidatus Omnitrophota bacterium]
MMVNLHEIDDWVSKISEEMNFYGYLTPINLLEEKEKFFKNIRGKRAYNPRFQYKERQFKKMSEVLREYLNLLDEHDDLHNLFINKIKFLLKQLEILTADDTNFYEKAVNLYGRPDMACLSASLKILSESKNAGYAFPKETVSPEEMAAILKNEIKIHDIGWKVLITCKIIPKITVSGKDKTVYINANIKYTFEEIERLKVHEIKTHVFRGENGALQPYKIFAEGLSDYNETEEGLAVLLEKAAGCHKIDARQVKLYAARAVCADLCLKKTFFETFTLLRKFVPEDLAYRLTERGKRGMRDTAQKGGLITGFHYISGWQKVRKYVEAGGNLRILYVGKVGLKDVEVMGRMLRKGELNAPRYLPELI